MDGGLSGYTDQGLTSERALRPFSFSVEEKDEVQVREEEWIISHHPAPP